MSHIWVPSYLTLVNFSTDSNSALWVVMLVAQVHFLGIRSLLLSNTMTPHLVCRNQYND